MRLFAVAVLVGLAGVPVAMAAPKTVVVAAGDCRNADLLTGTAAFHEALKQRWHDEVYAPDVVLSLLRPRAALSLEDVQRQVESARTLYYAGQAERALELARQALSELEKMSPQVKPWPIIADAMLLQGTSLKYLDRKAESVELFRRVLRIDAGFKLDPDLFAPSAREAFEVLRKDQLKARKSVLQVLTTPGAEVFIDGRAMGKAPLKVELVPGTYRVTVASGEQTSFPHLVTLPKDVIVQIDLGFEGALLPQTPLCLLTPTAPAESIAQKLANAVGAERLVVFWKEPRDGPAFYRALIMRLGVKDREGGVQAGLTDLGPVDELANFIVTGKGNGIVGGQGPAHPEPAVEVKAAPMVEAPQPQTPLAAVAAEPTTQPPATSHVSQVIGFSVLGAGAASALVGVVALALGEPDRARLATLTASGALPPRSSPGYQEAVSLLPKVQQNQALSFTMIGVGAGVAAAGVLTLVLFRHPAPTQAPTVMLVPLAHGAAVGLSGQF